MRPSFVIFLFCSAVLLRTLVGFHNHSGQNDDHFGGSAAYGGDFEAQRHWMELTLHLPLEQWYSYDAEYWGLDYPPLTAYVSYICGYLSHHVFLGPSPTEFVTSRGYEDPTHKAYMRATVLVLDVMIYFTATIAIATVLHPPRNNSYTFYYTIILALAQPSLILIDHGHFQYNSVALGFALWSFYYLTNQSTGGCVLLHPIVGAIFFCLALNFKQISLFYAPAVFAYLLGRCFRTNNMKLFLTLAMTVLLTFAILWAPFYYYSSTSSTGVDSLRPIAHRIFPFHRGLFESKVANLWCALSTRPISFRKRVSDDMQPILALLVTFVMILPPCIILFLVGKNKQQASTQQQQQQLQQQHSNKQHLTFLLWGATACSLAFFLAGFQVHEKSILFSLSPLSLAVMGSSNNNSNNDITFGFVNWFSMLAVWTLFPLMILDKLQLAYVCCLTIYVILLWIGRQQVRHIKPCVITATTNFYFTIYKLTNAIVIPCTLITMILLHVLEKSIIHPPPHLPDLFPVLWSIAGCAMFLWSYMYCVAYLIEMYFSSAVADSNISTVTITKKKQ